MPPCTVRTNLFSSSEVVEADYDGEAQAEAEIDGDGEGEGEWEDGDTSSDEFEGWLPCSGKVSSTQAPLQKSQQPTTSKPSGANLDQDLFNIYGLEENWELAEDLIIWLKSICNKEVPDSVLKELNEAFIPKEDLQPLFIAPALPAAVNTKLYTAPKSLSRVPKLINYTVLRAQKELCISYKPMIEVLNFFYSEEFSFITETVPQARNELSRLKHLVSQSLAIVISAGLKLSYSRKKAL